MTQAIRRSQFITTYGPGSIIEGPSGPRIIPRPDIGLFSPNGLSPDQFEISSSRMSEGLLHGARIFRLPSNAELGRATDARLYRTKTFPAWALCVAHRKLYFFLQGCPLCGGDKRGRQEA